VASSDLLFFLTIIRAAQVLSTPMLPRPLVILSHNGASQVPGKGSLGDRIPAALSFPQIAPSAICEPGRAVEESLFGFANENGASRAG
jgi:hypothetical protein